MAEVRGQAGGGGVGGVCGLPQSVVFGHQLAQVVSGEMTSPCSKAVQRGLLPQFLCLRGGAVCGSAFLRDPVSSLHWRRRWRSAIIFTVGGVILIGVGLLLQLLLPLFVRLRVEQWDSLLMFQVFPQAGLARRRQTLEAALILCFYWKWVFLKGRHRPVAGLEHLFCSQYG